jgi:hypothetical protein
VPSTPVFGIVYPCMGPAITLADFSNFATSVETAIATVDALATQATSPPNVSVGLSLGGVALGVATNITYTTEHWDSGTIATPISDALTVPANGMYMAAVNVGITGFATLTSMRAAITVNGTIQYAFKYLPAASTPTQDVPHGLLRLAAGDLVRCNFLWTGTGGPGTVSGTMSLTLHSRQF